MVIYTFQCYSLRSLTNLYFCPAVVTQATYVEGFQRADTVLRILCSLSHITTEQQKTEPCAITQGKTSKWSGWEAGILKDG